MRTLRTLVVGLALAFCASTALAIDIPLIPRFLVPHVTLSPQVVFRGSGVGGEDINPEDGWRVRWPAGQNTAIGYWEFVYPDDAPVAGTPFRVKLEWYADQGSKATCFKLAFGTAGGNVNFLDGISFGSEATYNPTTLSTPYALASVTISTVMSVPDMVRGIPVVLRVTRDQTAGSGCGSLDATTHIVEFVTARVCYPAGVAC